MHPDVTSSAGERRKLCRRRPRKDLHPACVQGVVGADHGQVALLHHGGQILAPQSTRGPWACCAAVVMRFRAWSSHLHPVGARAVMRCPARSFSPRSHPPSSALRPEVDGPASSFRPIRWVLPGAYAALRNLEDVRERQPYGAGQFTPANPKEQRTCR